jgi:hypothetical protein
MDQVERFFSVVRIGSTSTPCLLRQSLYLTQRYEKTKREGRRSYIAVLADDGMFLMENNPL